MKLIHPKGNVIDVPADEFPFYTSKGWEVAPDDAGTPYEAPATATVEQLDLSAFTDELAVKIAAELHALQSADSTPEPGPASAPAEGALPLVPATPAPAEEKTDAADVRDGDAVPVKPAAGSRRK